MHLNFNLQIFQKTSKIDPEDVKMLDLKQTITIIHKIITSTYFVSRKHIPFIGLKLKKCLAH